MQLMLEKKYGVKANEQVKLDSYDALRVDGWFYLIARPGNRADEEITELEKIAEHLRYYGDQYVPLFLPSKDGKLLTDWENNQYCVLANQQMEKYPRIRLGRKLAKFHERGRRVPFQIERSSRVGQWKDLWIRRLEQMEKVWSGLLFHTPDDEFERMFIESFPYYMGLTENAIQYLSDAEIDDEPIESDHGTVCHERFSYHSWGIDYMIKNPFDWVFDHRSRDLAEWTRERYFRNSQTYHLELKQFFDEYQSVSILSPFSWKLLYSRILFPLHYFDCVESYYNNHSEQHRKVLEEQLSKILRQSSEYERFLRGFYQLAGAPVKGFNLIQPEWIIG